MSDQETETNQTLTPEERKLIHQYQCAAMVYGFNEMVRTATDLGEKTFFRGMREGAEHQARDAGMEVTVAKSGWPTVLTLQAQPHVKFDERDIELMRQCVARHDEVRGYVALPREKVAAVMLAIVKATGFVENATQHSLDLHEALGSVPAPTEPMVTLPRSAAKEALETMRHVDDEYNVKEESESRRAFRTALGEP